MPSSFRKVSQAPEDAPGMPSRLAKRRLAAASPLTPRPAVRKPPALQPTLNKGPDGLRRNQAGTLLDSPPLRAQAGSQVGATPARPRAPRDRGCPRLAALTAGRKGSSCGDLGAGPDLGETREPADVPSGRPGPGASLLG